MAYIDMYSELTGSIPKLDLDFAKKLINRSWSEIRRKNLWSFQLFDANWISPAIVSTGTVTTQQGSNQVVFDVAAAAVLTPIAALGPFPTPLTQRQFRIGAASTIYNIWDWNSGTRTMTLDRPFVEASLTNSGYTVYQCYYPAPMQDWLTWIDVVDQTNFNSLNTLTTRHQLNQRDPQRSIFYLPTDVAPYQTDQNPDATTFGWQLFELWGQPAYVLPYQLYGIRRGQPLVADGDDLPQGGHIVGEDAVLEGAKVYAYEWAEAMKGEMPRNAGPDFKFLMGKCQKRFEDLIRQYRKDDRERVDNWYNVRRSRGWLPNVDGYFNSISGTANPGAPW